MRQNMEQSVIFALTNDGRDLKGDGKATTGWYLPEVAHPYYVLKENGFKIIFVSPKGGNAPLDTGSAEAFAKDEICNKFVKDFKVEKGIDTVAVSEVDPSKYKGLFFAGGHGPMFDIGVIPKEGQVNPMAELARKIYENNGILSAVCHGTCGFLPIKLSSGEYLAKGHTVTSFTNEEEEMVNLTKEMPFLLQTELEKQGAKFVAGPAFQCNVQVSGSLVTGQNPNSATKCGAEMARLLKENSVQSQQKRV